MSFKNSDLVVFGKPVSELKIEDFTDLGEMTRWEMNTYSVYDNKYGKYACEKDKIEALEDLFGKEFASKFYIRKFQLGGQLAIPVIKKRIENLNFNLALAEEFAEGKVKSPLSSSAYSDFARLICFYVNRED